ncbi:MAG: type I methionyl aminopeptidase [Clostridia bacterium]|nr:type I methionyl aminopeptidase [Clostridia bacterium]
MISIKSSWEIKLMRQAGAASAAVRTAAAAAVRPGVTTAQIDAVVRKTIASLGAEPAFLGVNGFPGAACVSVNDEVIHGVPGKRVIKEGDLVKIDVGARIGGYNGDTAITVPAGNISEDAARLIAVTKQSFYEGIKFARKGNRLTDISAAIQEYVESQGFSVVRDYTGHGIGRELWEDPAVPNYGRPGHGTKLMPGMVLAIEPMVNVGDWHVKVMPDRQTVKTADGKLSAHYEHTILITEGEPEILTAPETVI